jgi:hypothetical protein
VTALRALLAAATAAVLGDADARRRGALSMLLLLVLAGGSARSPEAGQTLATAPVAGAHEPGGAKLPRPGGVRAVAISTALAAGRPTPAPACGRRFRDCSSRELPQPRAPDRG